MTIAHQFLRMFGLENTSPSLLYLEAIVDAFSNIPYENITKIIRASEIQDQEYRLRTPFQVLSDYKNAGTGGTCFSLTNCLKAILDELGFQTALYMADLGRAFNNHCALILRHDDRQFLIDPGYLITKPLPIPEAGMVLHETRLHPVRLETDRLGKKFHLSTLEPDGEKFRYSMNQSPVTDFQFRQFWIDSFSWSMMNSILISKVLPGGRFYVHDCEVRWIGRQEKHRQKLTDQYDVNLSEFSGIDRVLIQKARALLANHKRSLKKVT